jgi:hypothetical protein
MTPPRFAGGGHVHPRRGAAGINMRKLNSLISSGYALIIFTFSYCKYPDCLPVDNIIVILDKAPAAPRRRAFVPPASPGGAKALLYPSYIIFN